MKNKFEEFLKLHNGQEPLLIGNVWNAQSARLLERKGFKALATSSAAVAETLGYADGQGMDIETYALIVKRIASTIAVPVSVDLEAGYGNTPEEIVAVITRFYDMGVSGINLEDSFVVAGKRSIIDGAIFSEKLKQIMKLLSAGGIRMFVNVRCDSFLLGLPNALDDALSRIDAYQHTGVQGLFLPCITGLADIDKVTARTTLPVNVMCIPGLPDFKTLEKAGVKRISMGPYLNMHVYQKLEAALDTITHQGSFDSLF